MIIYSSQMSGVPPTHQTGYTGRGQLLDAWVCELLSVSQTVEKSIIWEYMVM